MPKWSDMLARAIPWFRAEVDDTQRSIDDALSVRETAQAIAPAIQAQSDYMVRKGVVNGFTSQLTAGFQRRTVGE